MISPELRAEWRWRLVADPFAWRTPRDALACGNGSRAIRVRDGALDAFCKPLSGGPSQDGVASREKIASDLAYEMGGAAVPPVLLLSGASEPRRCVSLVVRPQHRPLAASLDVVERVAEREAPTWARAHVLCAWLGSHDQHPKNNMLWGYDSSPDDGELVVIDFASTMGHPTQGPTWAEGRGLRPHHVSGFASALSNACRGADYLTALERAEAIPEETIRDVVLRQPREWLGAAETDLIAECLLERRKYLRRLFAPFSAPTPTAPATANSGAFALVEAFGGRVVD